MSEVSFEVNGVRVVPDPSTAAWLPESRTLLVADLHFEKGSSFARRGLQLPPYDTKATLRALAEVFDRLRHSGLDVALRRGALRLSPHLYNTAEDIDRFLELS